MSSIARNSGVYRDHVLVQQSFCEIVRKRSSCCKAPTTSGRNKARSSTSDTLFDEGDHD